MNSQTFEQVPIEQVREYWDRRPCNIRHSTKPPGSREYFDEVERRKYFVEPHIPGFAEFPRWQNKRVLEIGCGIGTDTINFARHGARVTAVDLSGKSLEMARSRAEVFGLEDRIRFFQGSAEQLEQVVPPEPFDLVYSFGVIHHTPHPERVLEQLRNYVQPGSTVKIMVYHRYSWKVFWILTTYGKCQFWRLAELVARYSEAETGCPVTYSYSKSELRGLMERFSSEANSSRAYLPVPDSRLRPIPVYKGMVFSLLASDCFSCAGDDVGLASMCDRGGDLSASLFPGEL
jgi:2-polyprenyl-3-methyl-5-hydroxy-6-metoxy-1,4-benzoquinol methylase